MKLSPGGKGSPPEYISNKELKKLEQARRKEVPPQTGVNFVFRLFEAVSPEGEVGNDPLNYINGRDINIPKSFSITSISNLPGDKQHHDGLDGLGESHMSMRSPKRCNGRGVWEKTNGIPNGASCWTVEEEMSTVLWRPHIEGRMMSR